MKSKYWIFDLIGEHIATADCESDAEFEKWKRAAGMAGTEMPALASVFTNNCASKYAKASTYAQAADLASDIYAHIYNRTA